MSDNLVKAREVYEPFIALLNEQAVLLMQDLSMETVASLREDVAPEVHSKAETLFATIEAILSKEQMAEAEVNEILAEEESEVDAGMEDDTGMEDDADSE